MANYRFQYRILLANRPVDLTLNSLRCNWTFVSLRSTLSARFRLLLSLQFETYISKPTMELTFALDSAVKGLRDKGSPVLRRDMLMTASLQSSHFKCPLKKEKQNKQTNKKYQLFRHSLRRRRRFDLQSWTKWMGDLSPLPPHH